MKFQRKIPEAKSLFLERMQQLLPDKKDYKSYLNILKIPPVKSIRCNKLKISPDDLKKKLEAKSWKINQPWRDYPEVMIVEGKTATHLSSQINEKQLNNNPTKILSLTISQQRSLTKSASEQQILSAKHEQIIDLEPGELGRALEHLLGYYYIQELASMLPVIALKPKKNQMILDLCSAPGSKTTQLASEMNNTGTIFANEISMGRLKILASNLERCGVSNTIITKKDGAALSNKLKKQNIEFDRILVDAPCSGEGTLRSSLKTYLMWNIKTIKNLPKIQKNLFLFAFEILKKHGEIIYSTCTHAPEENEEVVNSILKELGNKIKLEKISLSIKTREGITSWQNKKYSNEVKKCARIYPQDNNTEGFFIAKFRKT